ncbi:hypothetical protein BH20ACT5_BH20ACT5_20130 [soil metagenome]
MWAAPGRLNVIGEHTDYNDGFALPIALPLRTLVAVSMRRDTRVALASVQHPGDTVECRLGDLTPGTPDGWAGHPGPPWCRSPAGLRTTSWVHVVALLRDGIDPRAIGPVLNAGHRSLRDDFEISTRELDAVVDSALECDAHGARLVGGGFGGSALVLIDTERTAAVSDAVDAWLREMGARPRAFVVTPADVARRLR